MLVAVRANEGHLAVRGQMVQVAEAHLASEQHNVRAGHIALSPSEVIVFHEPGVSFVVSSELTARLSAGPHDRIRARTDWRSVNKQQTNSKQRAHTMIPSSTVALGRSVH